MHKTPIMIVLASVLLLCLTILPQCAAQPAITILEPQAIVDHTQAVGNRTIRYYNFYITLRNDGDVSSDNITVYMMDPELHNNYTLGNCTLAPGQTETFNKTSHPIAIQGAFVLNVSYHPTQSIPVTPYNSGLQSFTIGSVPKTKSTPGFEWGLMLGALIIAGLVYRRKH
jgi:hypothetical protein